MRTVTVLLILEIDFKRDQEIAVTCLKKSVDKQEWNCAIIIKCYMFYKLARKISQN